MFNCLLIDETLVVVDIVYESIPIFDSELVCVLLISVNGTELIMYNSIVDLYHLNEVLVVVLPCPLVILEIVVI